MNRFELIKYPVFVGRVIAITLILGITLGPNVPVFAQGGDIGTVFSGLIESITEIVRTIAIGAGALGLTFWAVGKLVRPYFPSVSQMTSNYIPDLLVGLAVVFVANEIVGGLATALGGGGA